MCLVLSSCHCVDDSHHLRAATAAAVAAINSHPFVCLFIYGRLVRYTAQSNSNFDFRLAVSGDMHENVVTIPNSVCAATQKQFGERKEEKKKRKFSRVE